MNGTRPGSRSLAWLIGGTLAVAGSALAMTALGHLPQNPDLIGLLATVTGAGASVEFARRWIGARSVARAQRARRVLVVGVGPVSAHVSAQALEAGYEVLGYVEDADRAAAAGWNQPLLGCRGSAAQLARDLEVDQVIVSDGVARGWELCQAWATESCPAELLVVPNPHELNVCRLPSTKLGDVALVRLQDASAAVAAKKHYQTAKRALDTAASVVILGAGSPVLLLAAAGIKLTDGGPVFFKQERVGKDGKRFQVVKFRTMVMDAEKDGPQLCAGKADPRLTPVGSFLRRTHLDEVPQVWNVLRGEMSLVGPRPERPVFVEQFERDLPEYAERHRVLPGITGLAQIQGHYHSTPREKLRWDLAYIHHPSIAQDLSIIARTFLSALK